MLGRSVLQIHVDLLVDLRLIPAHLHAVDAPAVVRVVGRVGEEEAELGVVALVVHQHLLKLGPISREVLHQLVDASRKLRI